MRMKLHKSTANGDYEVYPIYEIDYQYLSNLGITIDQTSDSLSNHNFKGRRITCINANVRNGISTNIPLLETENGNIIPFWHRFRTQNNSKWYLDEENRASYSAIEQGVHPPDWGVNPNYIWLQTDYFEANGTKYFVYPRPVNISDSFSSSTSYYEDTKRTELRMFYTDTGCSFSVFKCSISRGAQNTLYARQYGAFGFPNYPSSTTIRPHYNMTTPENTGFGEFFVSKIEVGITSQYNTLSYWHSFDSFQNGCNCPMFFVHYNDNGTDFYGVAIVQMSSFTGEKETCFPIAIRFTVLDDTFWGSSIISGGESGAGNWGNNTVPTIAGGTFSEHSDNLSPTGLSPYTVTNTINDTESRISQTLVSRGAFSIYELATTTDLGQSSALAEIYTVLYNTDFLHNYYQSLYNPLSAVLATHLIPAEFISKYNPPASRKLTVSGYSISDKISERFPQQYPEPPKFDLVKPIAKYSFDAVDIEKYTDSYADFAPYTKFILHLPFIGKTEINANYLAHGSLRVEYACDLMSGNVIAYVWAKDDNGNSQYILSASGNCGYNVPMYSMNQDGSAVGKILTSAVQLGAGAIVGSATSMAKGAVGVVSGSIDTMLASKSTEISGTLGGNNTLISSKQLWLEIIRPKWIENAYYQRLKGIPAEMSNCLADQSQNLNEPSGIPYDGFIRISHIELDNVNCTESERSEIASLLSAGVYIRGEELLQ